MNSQLLESTVVNRYNSIAERMLKKSFPRMTMQEIREATNNSISKRFKNHDVKINNNYLNKTVGTSMLELANYIYDRKPIMTAYGCLFQRHSELANPLYNLIEEFIQLRVKYKKEMFKYKKGTEMYQKYNLLQLLAKIDTNAERTVCA